MDVRQRGGDLIEVNPYPSELTAMSRYALQGPAGEVLPRWRSWSDGDARAGSLRSPRGDAHSIDSAPNAGPLGFPREVDAGREHVHPESRMMHDEEAFLACTVSCRRIIGGGPL